MGDTGTSVAFGILAVVLFVLPGHSVWLLLHMLVSFNNVLLFRGSQMSSSYERAAFYSQQAKVQSCQVVVSMQEQLRRLSS